MSWDFDYSISKTLLAKWSHGDVGAGSGLPLKAGAGGGPGLCPTEVTSCSPVSAGGEPQRKRRLESGEQGHRK